ncbi:MAG: hypothetical protein NVV82_00465 [Sporocytophaga sp.]|nr:hypothetical protein [Sporocytophaga sp.]
MEILNRSFNIITGNLDLDNEQRFYFLSKFLEDKDPSKEVLKRELENAFSNKEFDLSKFISENDELLGNPDSYSREELINYIKGWIWDYLYPDKMLTIEQIEDLSKDVLVVLKDTESWMYSYDLYFYLKEKEEYNDLEYYNLWKIDFRRLGIEREPINDKEQEIGYLRYPKKG